MEENFENKKSLESFFAFIKNIKEEIAEMVDIIQFSISKIKIEETKQF